MYVHKYIRMYVAQPSLPTYLSRVASLNCKHMYVCMYALLTDTFGPLELARQSPTAAPSCSFTYSDMPALSDSWQSIDSMLSPAEEKDSVTMNISVTPPVLHALVMVLRTVILVYATPVRLVSGPRWTEDGLTVPQC